MQEDANAGGTVVLRDRYYIHAGSPLPDLDTPSAQAFVVEDRRDSARLLYALICRPDLPPRVNVMRALKGVQNPGLQTLVEWGVVPWAPVGRNCMAVVYERPMGGRVMTSLTAEIKRVEEHEVTRRMLTPIIGALRELNSRAVTHRAIRPTNMYYMDADRERIVLGDCVTAPPAYDQPLLFEPVESGMSLPFGRGSGNYGDDLYALGASLVLLLLGRNPVAHLTDEQLLKQKIVYGSYVALVGDQRLPISMIELLRGVLCDDPHERWKLDSLDLWLSGRRLSPLQTKLEKRTQRAFVFNGKEYSTSRELAMAFVRRWDDAIPLVLEGKLEIWMRRAIEDKERADQIAAAVRNAAGSPGDRRIALDVMLARVCILLDPLAPIRYKGLAMMPDGFGSALAVLMSQQSSDIRLFTEMIQREIPKLWFETRAAYDPDHSVMQSSFRDLKEQLVRPGLGFGLERCLYEMNEALACQSPLIAQDYVVEIRDLLPALNNAAKRADGKTLPVDRHVAAFIVARFKYDLEKALTVLNEDTPDRQLVGMLSLLALLQWRLGPETLFGLTSWIGGLTGPIIASFHSRETRRMLEREIPRLVRKGSLIELFRLLDNTEERQKDEYGFQQARAQYAAASAEISELDSSGEERDAFALRVGQQTAALTSVLIALATMSILVIMKVW